MNVRELITKLLACDMNAPVLVDDSEAPAWNAGVRLYFAGDSDGTVLITQFDYPNLETL